MVEELRRRPRVVAVVLLLMATAGWGASFIVMKDALTHMTVLSFLSWRFLLAGAVLVVLRPRALVRLGWRGIGQGALMGLMVTAGYFLQTFGLRTTPAAVSGFLTGLQVVFTPLIGWLLLRHRPGVRTWIATLVATTGLAVLSLRGLALGGGELLTIASSAAFALQIVVLGRWASVSDAYGFATVQLLVVGAASALAAAPSGIAVPGSLSMWASVAMTAVVASAFAFVAQSWAQSHLSASTAVLIFATEPVFAALFAWSAGEPIGWAVLAGGVLIVASMLVQVGGARRRAPAPEGRARLALIQGRPGDV